MKYLLTIAALAVFTSTGVTAVERVTMEDLKQMVEMFDVDDTEVEAPNEDKITMLRRQVQAISGGDDVFLVNSCGYCLKDIDDDSQPPYLEMACCKEKYDWQKWEVIESKRHPLLFQLKNKVSRKCIGVNYCTGGGGAVTMQNCLERNNKGKWQERKSTLWYLGYKGTKSGDDSNIGSYQCLGELGWDQPLYLEAANGGTCGPGTYVSDLTGYGGSEEALYFPDVLNDLLFTQNSCGVVEVDPCSVDPCICVTYEQCQQTCYAPTRTRHLDGLGLDICPCCRD
jgi:hypothetical protein